MKKLKYIFLFLLFIQEFSANDLLRQAEKAYDSKKYKDAVVAYEKLVNEGYRSYELYYNLGNAYYRNSELGRAIYYYELARKLEPGDEDVRINLAIASSKTIDKIDAKENFFISAVKTNVLSSFSTFTWAWISIGAVFLAAILFYLFVSSPVLRVKRMTLLSSAIFFIIFILSYFLGYSALKARNENKFAILSKEIKVVNEPTLSASPKFTLHEGTKIRVVEQNGDWVLIKLDNGNEGWLKLNHVGII